MRLASASVIVCAASLSACVQRASFLLPPADDATTTILVFNPIAAPDEPPIVIVLNDETPDTARPGTPLGRAVVRRLRLPGPPLGARLPSRIGSLASSVQRFAAATSRPVDVRRSLMGPGTRPGEVRPPRW